VLSNSHTHQSRSPMQTVFQKTYVRDFFSYYSFIIIYLCKLFFQIFLGVRGNRTHSASKSFSPMRGNHSSETWCATFTPLTLCSR
jgi:hypothetical protein